MYINYLWGSIMFSRRQIYYIVVMIIVSCVTIFGCVSSPPEVTPDNFDFNIDDIELQPSDLPEGYKLSDKLLCPSIQTTLFYESYDELYEQKFGVPDKKEYQSFENPNGDNGSILYFHYKEPLPAETKVFLSGLFWGTSTKPTSEHPEEFFVSDNEIVIWCFKADSKIKKISQDKLLNVITLGTSGKTFGKTGNEWAYSVQQTSDGGFILAGYTQSYGAGIGDVWSIKTDENGNMLWNKTFGGIKDDAATSVKQTLDGGYILAGWTESYGAGNLDAWVIKIDANGNEKWNKTFGGIVDDDTSSIQQTSDGGYVLAGTTFSYGAGSRDAWFIKIDANGNEQWNKTFGGSGEDGFNSMWETSDSGYILAGGTESYGTDNRDAWIIKTDANGNELWNRTFGGINLDEAYSVQQILDGDYVIAGLTTSYGAGGADAWLIKVADKS